MVRRRRVEFQASPDEYALIAQKALAAGFPTATYTRWCALGAAMPARKMRIEAETVAALNRLGAHLNQIARAANGKGLTQQQVQALAALHRKIHEAVTNLKGLMQ